MTACHAVPVPGTVVSEAPLGLGEGIRSSPHPRPSAQVNPAVHASEGVAAQLGKGLK